jgi:hypothetical protein
MLWPGRDGCCAVGAATAKHSAVPKLRGSLGHENFPASFFFATRNKLPWSGFCKKTYWGWGMSPREVIACYRLYAAYCIEIAQRLSDRGGKIALLNMAQTWIALAQGTRRMASRIRLRMSGNGGCHCHG